MKLVGQSYLFCTDLPYAEEHNGKEVVIVNTNGHVSICETEEGKTFAAFNVELRYSMRDVAERYEKPEARSVVRRWTSSTQNLQSIPKTRTVQGDFIDGTPRHFKSRRF